MCGNINWCNSLTTPPRKSIMSDDTRKVQFCRNIFTACSKSPQAMNTTSIPFSMDLYKNVTKLSARTDFMKTKSLNFSPLVHSFPSPLR